VGDGFRVESMAFRVQILPKAEVVTFILSGRFRAEEVPELQSLFAVEENRHIVLDLEEVKLVDRDAVRFLACCEANGIQLENCSAYIREWIATEPTQPDRSGSRNSRGG
jgi:hypothetical protein